MIEKTLRRIIIALANVYIGIAFRLLRSADIKLYIGTEDELRFNQKQCGREYRITLMSVNFDRSTERYSESIRSGALVSFVPQLAAKWKGDEH